MTERDLVIGIDSSTQSTKAIAWTKDGTGVAEGRADIPLYNRETDAFEQSTTDWWNACRSSLKELAGKIDKKRVAGISISNQRETVGFLDQEFNECAPAIVWIDSRCISHVKIVSDALGEKFIHEMTGRPIDKTPVLYRLAWLRDTKPELYNKTEFFVDVQAFLVWKLSGKLHTSWTSADPFGMFDIHQKTWCNKILDYLDINVSQLPVTFAPSDLIGTINLKAANETGMEEGIPIFAGGGDGQCAGLGTNCVAPGKAYINLGTAVVSGVWNQTPNVHKAWRTEIAAQGDGYILETCQLSGAFLVNWFVDQFVQGGRHDKTVFKKLEEELKDVAVGSLGLVTLPFWAGVMNPYWDQNATGCMIGLKGTHKPAHLYRSILEGITLHQAQSLEFMREQAGIDIARFIAIGGGSTSHLWTKMLADSTNRKVETLDIVEATSLGAAMLAAYGTGWYESIHEASDRMKTPVANTIIPDPEQHQKWTDLLEIYKNIYTQVCGIYDQINKFNLKHGN